MRPILFVLSAAILITAPHAFAAGKKKPTIKKPPPTALVAPPVPEPSAAATGAEGGPAVRGPTRIDFDDRLIQGQSNKSGAVYLYDRKELKIRSMIKKRENFRDEIVGSLYDT